MYRQLGIVTMLLLALVTPGRASEALTATQTAAIDKLLEAVYEGAKLPSLVAMIDRGGATLYARALGHANLSHAVPATVQTAYAIGSISKTFTGLAIAQLVHAGSIDLEATVADYLPDYSGPGRVATVANLLTHSSGIPSYNTEIPGVREALSRNAYTRQELVALFEGLPLNFAPGTRFSYSNSGYYLLGLIIEAVAGKDYYSHIEAEIFEPLEMNRSSAGDLSVVVEDMARGYDLRKGAYVHAPVWHQLVPFSAGSLVSTAADVIAYRRGVFHSPAIPDPVREQLLSTTSLAGGEENNYSLGGLVLSEFHGHNKVSHAGDIWGYASNHAYYPEEDLTIVLLANRSLSRPAPASLEAKLARIVLGIPQPEIRKLALTQPELARYAGDFDVKPFLIGFDKLGFLAGENGQLLLRFGGTEASAPAIPLLAQGDGVFRAPFDDEWVFRFSEEEPRAARVTSNYRDGTIAAVRVDRTP
ncbi:serine hydrolase domain-containing protein [Pseudohaliea rubra]|uniref:Beta-lactamase n=1 Tax=Pseudohaliea rubra DSM 19751 TaxID=1265313 RepID=A0A095VTG2_9GAMM|nr:serine hydrolase domain-containing protein [Pseudohaliea rubra]KGE04383.1 beta-lactamase [Pseudohaliea rubra DSM 19751]